METILNWYLIGVMVNLVCVFIIILIDKFINKIEQKMDKNEDAIVLSVLLILSWSVWVFTLVIFVLKFTLKLIKK